MCRYWYIFFVSIYLSIHPPIHTYIHTHTNTIFFLGDVEQKQIDQASWKREGRRTVIHALNCLGTPGCSALTLPAPGFLRMRQVAVPGRSILGEACAFPPPRPVQSGRWGRDARGRDAGLPGDSSVPVSRPPQPRPPPPGAGLRSARAAGAVKQPRGAPQRGARLLPRVSATAPCQEQ